MHSATSRPPAALSWNGWKARPCPASRRWRPDLARVYLAGPDVFLPDAIDWLARKQAICAGYGLVGVSPLDPFADEPTAWAEVPQWYRIALRNEAHIRSCAAVIANLTPFRGPSADVGTVYEVGFARGLGLKVFGYATTSAGFLDRTQAQFNTEKKDGAWWDQDGLMVEQFGLFDNLMVEAALMDTGGLIREDADRWRDLTLFERCVTVAARALT